jgi:sialate O-acetylesterase
MEKSVIHHASGKSVLGAGLLLLLVACMIPLRGEVILPSIFGDHMILQQGMSLPVWGKAKPGEKVTVSLGGRTAQTEAGVDGSWRVMLAPFPETSDALTMAVQGENLIEIQDVIVGDVWVCAGEGNMEFPLSDAVGGKDDHGATSDSLLRFYLPNTQNSTQADSYGKGHWVVCSPQDSADFSAVGYFFARDLRSARHLPVGIIQCTKKDAPLSSWISRKSSPSTASSTAFNDLISPLIPYAISGMIWYQGESDAGLAALQYRRLFPRLIRDWRADWKEGPFPFFFVLSAGFGEEGGAPVEAFSHESHSLGRGLPWLREGEEAALTLPNTGVAVATDLGLPDELHPPDKLDVGRRLAMLARKQVYGEEIVDAGPTYRAMHLERGKVRLEFDGIGSGLTMGVTPAAQGDDAPSLSTRLMGFALAGANGKWYPAMARIEGNTVLLGSDAVPFPLKARYNWKGFPNGNLYNKEGLPAAAFRTDSDQPESFR